MANPKKVFLVVTKSNLGGAQRYVYDVARMLPKDAFAPTIVTGPAGWLQEACTATGIPSVTIPSFTRDISFMNDVRAFFDLVALFSKEKPAIVHLNSSKIGVLGALAARGAGVPRIVFTAHGWAFNEKRSPLAKFLFWIAHSFGMLLSDCTIANSEATARTAPLQWKLVKIPLGIEAPEFIEKSEARKLLSIPEEKVIVGTIAELHRNKGIDVFIEALSSVPDVHAVIIGDGEEKTALKERANKNGTSGRITFAGHIDNAAKYLRAFDVFVLPSRTESFGYVLLEAGYAGLPVIASNTGGIPELVENDRNGILVKKEDSRALAEALRRLAGNALLRKEYGEHMRQEAERYSLARMIEKTCGVYER